MPEKLISVVTPCFNEQDNVRPLFEAVKKVFSGLPQYRFEHIFIDNCSTDSTQRVLEEMAAADKRVKVIFNARNFGHIRSPYYGMTQAKGDAVISVVADFQDPPEMIVTFLEKWERGYMMALGVKPASKENKLVFALRKMYYSFVRRISETELGSNFTGFGLYDKSIIEIMRQYDDPYPYLRGLVCEIGFEKALVEFEQPRRARGVTKNNFYTLYDMAMLGITSHSKLPLRIATMAGFGMALLSLLAALIYLVFKLIRWDWFDAGVAPLTIGVFFIGSVQLFFIGILGEYIGNIYTQVKHRPLVTERKRLNFDE